LHGGFGYVFSRWFWSRGFRGISVTSADECSCQHTKKNAARSPAGDTYVSSVVHEERKSKFGSKRALLEALAPGRA
jgi:hypothetical protein